ncbi:hypothetical protein A4X13_0g6114 [Tilletia indica]|uniref:Uncharacterized protein n=1 Tax=Tilletia indica TaxID=43049 RepID=A0A177T977_9BASI|nr:hypothetical protein A4X13_0g6114 [Tilletia indica]
MSPTLPKTTSSTQDRIVQPHGWAKRNADVLQQARAQVDDLTASLAKTVGVKEDVLRNQVLLKAPNSRRQSAWNTLMEKVRSDPTAWEARGVPKIRTDQQWNDYIKKDLSKFWQDLKKQDPDAHLSLKQELEKDRAQSIPKLSIRKVATNFRREHTKMLRKIEDLETNHAITAITIFAHPDPLLAPKLVLTEHGMALMQHIMALWKTGDTVNALVERINSGVNSNPPPSYRPLPLASTNTSTTPVEHLSDQNDSSPTANPPPAPHHSAAQSPPTTQSSPSPRPSSDAEHQTFTASSALSNSATSIPAPAPVASSSVPVSTSLPSSTQMTPSSSSIAPVLPSSSTFISAASVAGPVNPPLAPFIPPSSGTPRLAGFVPRMCSRPNLPGSHAERVPYVARQLLLLLCEGVDRCAKSEDIVEDWTRVTEGMSRIPYSKLFSILNGYDLWVEGWPRAAEGLLLEYETFIGSQSPTMEVYDGGLVDTSGWTDTQVLALAQNIADGTLQVEC